ncbi:transposase [Streptomyces sp. NBC_00557]|uniref:transposase n=1 Tax=Streptomyces sp. NBC_00557 TaxID=2975776 RepID=UPI002E824A2E|nr:transposase [Streptomyces sp. NBC_00557]WUC33919.1 transposase [Streptomyces sp. NBC_00557]
MRRAGVEGTGSFGAALSRYLTAVGAASRTPLDAQNAARAVLRGRACAQAKAGDGPVEIARMYKPAKDSAVKARTQAINQLKAVLIRAHPQLREELAGLGNAELFRTCAGLADNSLNDEAGEGSMLHATHVTLGLLARRIGQLSEEVQHLKGRLTRLVEHHTPQLLEVVGIGPDSAVSPVERSSGSRHYRRINRGGDRQANAALHRIVQTRLRVDPRTQDYCERRSKEGKTRRDIVRSLERYAAREVFHLVRPVQSQPALQGQS